MILRTSWLYSEYGGNFVKTMLKLGKEKDEIGVVNDQIGSPTYANDLAKAILSIVNGKKYQNQDSQTEIYHYSNKGEISWHDFAKEIFKLTKINCKVSAVTTGQYPTLAKRPKNTSLNKGKIMAAFDLEIEDWRCSLGRYIMRTTHEIDNRNSRPE